MGVMHHDVFAHFSFLNKMLVNVQNPTDELLVSNGWRQRHQSIKQARIAKATKFSGPNLRVLGKWKPLTLPCHPTAPSMRIRSPTGSREEEFAHLHARSQQFCGKIMMRSFGVKYVGKVCTVHGVAREKIIFVDN